MQAMMLECLACGDRTIVTQMGPSAAMWANQHYLPMARFAVIDVDGERQEWVHGDDGWYVHGR
jgi:hypothetical protein